ncbi:LysR substrate-binding domain-containing protein [Amycolatopsis sp. OK19-0408]|uniref:LysR substrate-binding domain-containing protein n=1 Tax=Amycolatopsis iheyensis TaxID=2945988 RepID=A0A9X2NI27_9PSEU|nr:LysR substrate-binding domain-containing protein [Amycolatopsis iheyensis]MCR6485175.1 LysR substrate-binding domain-containing protein [Amycolatopsis iheyensis]
MAVVLPTPDVPPAGGTRFDQHLLLDDRLDLLVRGGHPLARRDRVEFADAAGESWVVKTRDNDTYQLLLAACAAAGFTPRVGHHVKEWYAASAVVAEGLGVCLLPIPSAHAVRRLPLTGSPRPSRRISAYVRRGSAAHPVVARGLAALRTAAQA